VKLRLKPWVNMEPRSSKADESAIARPPPGGPSAIANTPNTTRLVQLLLDDRSTSPSQTLDKQPIDILRVAKKKADG
jgi:hypothetical protein